MCNVTIYAFIGLGCALSVRVQAGHLYGPPTSVPKIAQIAGVRVGLDTRGEMERRLGRGMVYTGGHPGGAREWNLRGTRWFVDSDAFDYYSGRRSSRDGDTIVVYDVTVGRKMWSREAPVRRPPLPTTRRTHRPLGWLGVIYPGVPKAEVLRAIHGKLPLPQRSGDEWKWTAQGYVRLNEIQAYHTWTATLTFRRGRPEEINVSCERDD